MNAQKPTAPVEASRPMGVAQELSATVLDTKTIFSRRVVLTGELDTLSTANGRWCLFDAMRLLSRVVGVLQVALPRGLPDLDAEVRVLADGLWSQGSVEVRHIDETDFNMAVAILNVGHQGRDDVPWTSVNSDGWLARCTSTATAIPADCRQANPLGAMLAASAGVAEVFKRVYGVPTEAYPMMDGEQLSLFSLDPGHADIGPPLPEVVRLPSTLIVGAGAIGNALILLWSQLPLEGTVHILDKQVYGEENLGTCCLLDQNQWLGGGKAELLAGWLKANAVGAIEATGEQCMVGDAVDGGSLTAKRINLVINGLDDNQARHDAQRLWPSLIVDGAINSFGAAVVTHSLERPDWACLKCTFPLPEKDALGDQARATGLGAASLDGDTNRPISEADIAAAAPEVQEELRAGRQASATLCSMLPRLLARQRLGVELEEGFRPSVPFVASAAAALTMAQVLRHLNWPDARRIHEFQIADLFRGFHTSLTLQRHASMGCQCTTQRDAILALTKRRLAADRTFD
ncbi:ThiF family adenylyltransferase [Roseateles microcysteis]|uniref:ThiF family adenylyltransferase n=1 Tax=Roseateles microcysteis TaxID=3119057 RepID=UPI002FE6B63B